MIPLSGLLSTTFATTYPQPGYPQPGSGDVAVRAVEAPGAPPVASASGGGDSQSATMRDEGRLQQLSRMLGLDDEGMDQVSRAVGVVSSLQAKRVEISVLRDVLRSGDLFDVTV